MKLREIKTITISLPFSDEVQEILLALGTSLVILVVGLTSVFFLHEVAVFFGRLWR